MIVALFFWNKPCLISADIIFHNFLEVSFNIEKKKKKKKMVQIFILNAQIYSTPL